MRTGNGLKSDTVFALAVSNTNVMPLLRVVSMNSMLTQQTLRLRVRLMCSTRLRQLSQDVAFDQASNRYSLPRLMDFRFDVILHGQHFNVTVKVCR